MMQVYDRMFCGSRSEGNFLTLTLWVVFPLAMMGCWDYARRAHSGPRRRTFFKTALDKRVFFAVLHQKQPCGVRAKATRAPLDLESCATLAVQPGLLSGLRPAMDAVVSAWHLHISNPWLDARHLRRQLLVAYAVLNQISTKTGANRVA